LKNYSLIAVLLIVLVLHPSLSFSTSIEDAGMVLVCNDLNSTTIYNCSDDIPNVPTVFDDTTPNGDLPTFQSIDLNGGVGPTITNECNPPIITYTEQMLPYENCTDTYTLIRTYTVDDQSGAPQTCTHTIVANTPTLDRFINPLPTIVGSDQNVDSIFQKWVDLFGFAEEPICGNNLSFTISPNPPNLDPQTVCEDRIDNDYPQIMVEKVCQFKRVQWDLINDCGTGIVFANFYVIDTLKPEISCPLNQSFNIADADIISDIETHLDGATAEDECGDIASLVSNFDPATVAESCDLVYSIDVLFTATDICGNENTCSVALSIINSQGPSITCPDNDLVLECGDPT